MTPAIQTRDWWPHTDYGFVTILDVTAPGLQIKVNDTFVDVPVLPGHLAIHFGEALNFITLHSERTVGAVEHQVLSQNQRTQFVMASFTLQIPISMGCCGNSMPKEKSEAPPR